MAKEEFNDRIIHDILFLPGGKPASMIVDSASGRMSGMILPSKGKAARHLTAWCWK